MDQVFNFLKYLDTNQEIGYPHVIFYEDGSGLISYTPLNAKQLYLIENTELGTFAQDVELFTFGSFEMLIEKIKSYNSI